MKLLSVKPYGLHTLEYPSGRWGYVGSIPIFLCKKVKGTFCEDYQSMVFETEEQAIKYFEDNKHLLTS